MASNVQNWFEEVVLRTNLKKNIIRLCQRQVKTDYLSINHSSFFFNVYNVISHYG
jgi:hypothetical protein